MKNKREKVVKEPRAKYKSEAMSSIHDLASDLHSAGVVSRQTMRNFDALCLTPVEPMSPEQIRSLREREGVSQAVMAMILNVTTNAVGQWERGEKRPAGASLKLLTLVQSKGLDAIR